MSDFITASSRRRLSGMTPDEPAISWSLGWTVGPAEGYLEEFQAIFPMKTDAEKYCDWLNADPDRGCDFTVASICYEIEVEDSVIEAAVKANRRRGAYDRGDL